MSLSAAGALRCDLCPSSAACVRLEPLPPFRAVGVLDRYLRPVVSGVEPAGYRYFSHGWCAPLGWDRGWFRGSRRVNAWGGGRRLVDRCAECVRGGPVLLDNPRQLVLFAVEVCT